MNLKETDEIIASRTAKLGDLTRQLALAGIAVIWIFKKDVAGQPAIPKDLFVPGIWIILSLTFDLLQYALASVFLSVYRGIKAKELQRGREEERSEEIKKVLEIQFGIPNWFNYPQYFCLIAKVTCLLVAYWLLLNFLYRSIPVI